MTNFVHTDFDSDTLEVRRVDNPQRYSRAAIFDTFGQHDVVSSGSVIVGDDKLTDLLVHLINPVIRLRDIGGRVFNADGYIYMNESAEANGALTPEDARAYAVALLRAADVAEGVTDNPIDTDQEA